MANTRTPSRELEVLDRNAGHAFKLPVKCIHDGDDVSFFLTSKAYADIMTFLFQLNASMMPRKVKNEDNKSETVREWTLQDSDSSHHHIVESLAEMIADLESLIEQAPPDPGPRRFGNISFRRWHELVEKKVPDLMHRCLPSDILELQSKSDVTAKAELEAYLLGSFGSAQRLDYGTGHELSFLAFLGCLWKLGAFPESVDGSQERAIVLGVVEPYLRLVRRLILTYTLEPAGSHGVWGLDDHSFLPYVFGSAQYSPAISSPSEIAMEGSLPNAPNPADIAKAGAVERERQRNMYFSAIGFIYDVKKGPFWEHSPILFDISGVKAGWAKINKGMLKMYNAEVLSKFPVVQHFHFGSLFTWERDPAAQQIQASVHTTSQPKTNAPSSRPQPALRDPMAVPGVTNSTGGMPPAIGTSAPWASSRVPSRAPVPAPTGPNQPTRAPWTSSTPLPPPGGTTTAPWARLGGNAAPLSGRDPGPGTRAPWADRKPQS
ncbi:Phosphotyrosyl phosphatase activator [Lentithecium fluviatile CBS 122367]|uniref:Serine/threonine-protein phosphatase 2A activator n=1 Tax=Lentithecium fluviatile CBS 122367 TaxID=1168545 RepID=A0A6G1IP17_9PLEO|nr:Phosphotyrosyl phosphatase activator [Lentithecium fluviatile CBS 122367]